MHHVNLRSVHEAVITTHPENERHYHPTVALGVPQTPLVASVLFCPSPSTPGPCRRGLEPYLSLREWHLPLLRCF